MEASARDELDDDGGWRARGAVAFVGGVGVVTFLANLYHLLVHDLPLLGATFGVAIPMLVSASLVGCAVWLRGAGFGPHTTRVASWTLTGGVVLLALGTANVVFQRATGGLVADATIVLVAQTSVGALLGFLLGVYDVQRTLTSERLLDERETATRFSRRLNVLNRVLRHDIRNKVNVIRGNADLVAAGSGETETAADTIRKQAEEMFQLSEYARELQAVMDQEDVATETVDVGTSIAAKAMRLHRDHPHATVNQNVADVAWADVSPFVDSAIENLLANAVEHNDADAPTVWVDVEVDDGEGVVAVRIADDGPGIPEAEVAVLQRGRETSLEHASGLGLWLVHWIVTESGGSVSFEEREPRGSVVELTLPLADPPDDADGAGPRDDDGDGGDEPGNGGPDDGVRADVRSG